MKTSVIMCTRNRLSFLIRFTKSLCAQVLLPDEYIIVDSSDVPMSQDEVFSLEVKGSLPESVLFKYFHTKPGLTYQRNYGIRKSTGDLLFFFDDDIILESLFLKNIKQVFIEFPHFYGGVGNMSNYDNPSFYRLFKESCRGFFGLQRSFGDGKFYKSGFPKFPYGTTRFIETEVLGGGLTAYRKDVFDHFAFDEKLTGYSYMEDVDFSRRVSYKFKCFYNPLARCEHRHAESGRDDVAANRKMLMVNFRYFYFKNFYGRNGFSIFHHWFSIFGMFVVFFGFKKWKGLILGLVEFSRKRQLFFKER